MFDRWSDRHCPTKAPAAGARPTTGQTRLFEHRLNCCVRPVNAGSEDDNKRLNLVKLYKDEAVLDLLRERLMGPEVFLATKEEANKLLNNISQRMDELRKDAELLNWTVSAGEDPPFSPMLSTFTPKDNLL
ncbi:hypothetical protein PCASD_03480 [Puccinia coronata f. sp. avenae]|uniref:Uncharacterized protein n=1 Tax=Puccinia coronata f. sp. avenae TaxID=200324 RepID=A0A2N5V7L4_9BASI|nr:hypothetical protein PCASD_03480 [Puccinia coronata f. sp. avenae]